MQDWNSNNAVRLLSLQCELSMKIGAALDLGEMLRGFLVVLVQRFQAQAAQVWLYDEDCSDTPLCHAYPACSCEEWPAEQPLYQTLLACFRARLGGHTLIERSNGLPMHVLCVGGVGLLMVAVSESRLDTSAFSMLEALMPRLAFACQACMDHARKLALLDLLKTQNIELELARARAESVARIKSEYVATLSHEMRTPLNGILGFAELLQLELAGTPQADYAKSIHASGRHLFALFGDMLDLAKIDARKLTLHPEEILIAEFVRDTCAPHVLAAQEKGLQCVVSLEAGLPACMVVDPVRLRQILNNLLSNAFKFTERGSVRLTVSAQTGNIAFAVRDTGPGIPEEAQVMVFERFAQANNVMQRHSEGSGLGLAIARELAEQMGGRVDLQSTPGEGSLFTLRLPQMCPPEPD